MTETPLRDPDYRLPPGEPKFRRRSAYRQAEIVAAARILFDRYGAGATTFAMIAADAGLSRGGVNRHFPTRASLNEAVTLAITASNTW